MEINDEDMNNNYWTFSSQSSVEGGVPTQQPTIDGSVVGCEKSSKQQKGEGQ
jgi:hypothetical protein